MHVAPLPVLGIETIVGAKDVVGRGRILLHVLPELSRQIPYHFHLVGIGSRVWEGDGIGGGRCRLEEPGVADRFRDPGGHFVFAVIQSNDGNHDHRRILTGGNHGLQSRGKRVALRLRRQSAALIHQARKFSGLRGLGGVGVQAELRTEPRDQEHRHRHRFARLRFAEGFVRGGQMIRPQNCAGLVRDDRPQFVQAGLAVAVEVSIQHVFGRRWILADEIGESFRQLVHRDSFAGNEGRRPELDGFQSLLFESERDELRHAIKRLAPEYHGQDGERGIRTSGCHLLDLFRLVGCGRGWARRIGGLSRGRNDDGKTQDEPGPCIFHECFHYSYRV